MGHFLSHLSLLLLLVAINHAADLTGRDYWNSILPKTPMPNTITELLDSGKQNPRNGHTRIVGSLISSKVKYCDLSSETQLENIEPNVAIYFLEKDLHPGKKITFHFSRTTNAHDFIPRSETNKLPFSSSKLSEILDHFKIAKDSSEADVMKHTLNDCERLAINGEKKQCATSLESMVDFATSSLKTRDVQSSSTNANHPNAPKQEYTVIKSKILARNELVACHMEPYAYAVFYCHMLKPTNAYMVNLVGKNGDRVAAIAACHMDTSSWDPKHLAFQMLNVQPGTIPVCHFLLADGVAWTRAM